MPGNCVVQQTCDIMMTYTKIEEDTFKFELTRSTTVSNQYVAMGLSTTPKMPESSVMACTVVNDTVIDVAMYWNTNSYNSMPLSTPHLGLAKVCFCF